MVDSTELMQGFPPAGDRQVSIHNMHQGPYNRWAFGNLRRLLPTARVAANEDGVLPLPLALVDLNDIRFDDSGHDTLTVRQMLDQGCTDGFVVLHHGRIVAERYGEGIDPREPRLLLSVSKSVVGSLAGIIIDRGLLSPDDLVTDVVPEVVDSAFQRARIRDLLDMTVSVDYIEDYDDAMSDVAELDVAAGWRSQREGVCDNLRDYIRTVRPAGEHGDRFYFVSVNTDLLGWVLERVTGVDIATLLAHEIWQPMGAESDGYVTLDRFGAPYASMGLCVTTRDLARFGQLHAQNGRINGRRVMPSSWITDYRNNGDTDKWERGNYSVDMPGYHYRSQWFTDLRDPHRPSMAIGAHGQMLYVDPVKEIVIAKHSSQPQPDNAKLFDDMRRAFLAIAYAL